MVVLNAQQVEIMRADFTRRTFRQEAEGNKFGQYVSVGTVPAQIEWDRKRLEAELGVEFLQQHDVRGYAIMRGNDLKRRGLHPDADGGLDTKDGIKIDGTLYMIQHIRPVAYLHNRNLLYQVFFGVEPVDKAEVHIEGELRWQE